MSEYLTQIWRELETSSDLGPESWGMDNGNSFVD